MRKEKAITLISLVITVILIIILAGIGINLSLGENGLFSKAKYAKEETNKQTATEKINLKITNCQINTYSEREEMPTLKELSIALKEDKEIEYVTEESQKMASTKYEVGEDPTSIFTKLKEYPYEFEINGSLQLASINGIKVAQTPDKKESSMKVLYDGTMHEGTITFEENTIDDYDYYEFIWGHSSNKVEVGIGTGNGRIFSQIVSKEYLKLFNTTGDYFYLTGVASSEAVNSIYITNVTSNSITLSVLTSGTSWASSTGCIYKIIGRNI